VPKINQLARTDDWRYLQGYQSPILQNGCQDYHLALLDGYKCTLHLLEGKYWWMEGIQHGFQLFKTYLEKMII
jgi:hypothetical protein